MITINRDEFRSLLMGIYCNTNQTVSKEEAAKYVEGGLKAWDLLTKSLNKPEIKVPDQINKELNDGQRAN